MWNKGCQCRWGIAVGQATVTVTPHINAVPSEGLPKPAERESPKLFTGSLLLFIISCKGLFCRVQKMSYDRHVFDFE